MILAKTKNSEALDTTHLTAVFGVAKIWKMFFDHERFVKITPMFPATKVMKDNARTWPTGICQ